MMESEGNTRVRVSLAVPGVVPASSGVFLFHAALQQSGQKGRGRWNDDLRKKPFGKPCSAAMWTPSACLPAPVRCRNSCSVWRRRKRWCGTVGEPLAAVPVLERLLRRYLDGEYTAISAAAMAQVVSALLYFVSPWDLYPDSVPGKGYADDAAVLDCCWKLCQPELEAYLAWEREQLVCRNGSAGA